MSRSLLATALIATLGFTPMASADTLASNPLVIMDTDIQLAAGTHGTRPISVQVRIKQKNLKYKEAIRIALNRLKEKPNFDVIYGGRNYEVTKYKRTGTRTIVRFLFTVQDDLV